MISQSKKEKKLRKETLFVNFTDLLETNLRGKGKSADDISQTVPRNFQHINLKASDKWTSGAL